MYHKILYMQGFDNYNYRLSSYAVNYKMQVDQFLYTSKKFSL